jgi:hypothetical protein
MNIQPNIDEHCKWIVSTGDRIFMQLLWLNGTKVEDIAATFEVPVDWVEDFVQAETHA